MIEVNHICKSYGKVCALSDVSFSVQQGELFGLIGGDGAGKSTMFRILTTLLLADQGTASVSGLDVVRDYKKIRAQVGYMPGRFSLYGDLSVQENLQFFATLFNTSIKENYHLIEDIYVQLEPFKKRRATNLSGGMKQKLALCCALIHSPTVLFLDEPTTGVDPVSRKEFWIMLSRLKKQGITILVSTPYMDEALLCERIALVRQGSLMTIDTPQNIMATFGQPLWAITAHDMPRLLKTLRQNPSVGSCYAFGQHHHITLKGVEGPSAIMQQLQTQGFTDINVEQIDATIEDCYLKMTADNE